MGHRPRKREEVIGLGMTMEVTEVGTLLGNLASRLRNDGLALMGMASREPDPESLEHKDLHGLAGSLMRTAGLIEFIKAGLCRRCLLQDVREMLTFGDAPEDEKEPKPKGGANGQNREKDREKVHRRKTGRGKGRRRKAHREKGRQG